MKNAKTMVALLVFFVVASIGAGYVAGFLVYKEYKKKTVQLEEEARDSFKRLDAKLKDLYVAMERTTDQNAIERKKALVVIEKMKEDIEEWERRYALSVTELKETVEGIKVEKLTRMVENLQDDIENFKMTVQDLDIKVDEVSGKKTDLKTDLDSIDLGRISVKK